MKNPFSDLSKVQISRLYDLLAVHIYKYNRNEEILPTIRKENIVGIILSGWAQVIDVDSKGNGIENVVEELEKNSVFGSSLSATNSDNYQIIARDDVQVLVIDYEKLVNPKNLNHPYYNIFYHKKIQNLIA